MRVLVVAAEYPWPVNSGSRLRLLGTLGALRSCGPVDLVSITPEQRTDFDPPPADAGLASVARVAIDDRPPSSWRWLPALLRPDVPFDLPTSSQPAVQRALADLDGDHQLRWYFRVRAWALGRDGDTTPSVVDLDDLEDHKILARLQVPPARRSDGHPDGLRARLADQLSKENARRWRRLHRTIAAQASATVVCSDLDRRRLGLPGVAVVPNGYDAPARPVGRDTVGDPPTILLQGTLRYGPNADGARFLVRDIAPLLWREQPDVALRLVGRTSPAIERLGDDANVTVVGQVPDITAELARADLVAVPLRYGSGTRVKILEAFAHRVPVVATTLGAEGLDVADGVHLLLADEPAEFARACLRVLRDAQLRRSLVDEAERLFSDRYRTERAFAAVAELARAVVAGPR